MGQTWEESEPNQEAFLEYLTVERQRAIERYLAAAKADTLPPPDRWTFRHYVEAVYRKVWSKAGLEKRC